MESVHKSLPADGQPCARPGDKACITILHVIHALPPSRTQGCPQPPEMRLIHPSHTPGCSGRNPDALRACSSYMKMLFSAPFSFGRPQGAAARFTQDPASSF